MTDEDDAVNRAKRARTMMTAADRLAGILALFRLEFKDPSLMLPRIARRPVYLAMAMDDDEMLRFKPQNLLVNLPLAPDA